MLEQPGRQVVDLEPVLTVLERRLSFELDTTIRGPDHADLRLQQRDPRRKHFGMQQRTPDVEADAGGVRLREERSTLWRQHRHIAHEQFRPVEAPARIHALEADIQVRGLIDPRLDLITILRQVCDRDAHRADQQRKQDDEAARGPRDPAHDAARNGPFRGGRLGHSCAHISTTSNWSTE